MADSGSQSSLGIGTTSFQDINTKFVGPGSSFVARLTANVTPTLLNEFVASYTSDHIFLTALNNPALPAGLPIGALFANGFGGKLPSVDLKGNNAYGGEFGQDTGYFPWNDANPTYTYRDNVTKFLGITPSSSAPISPRDQRTRRTPPTFRAF